MKRPILTAITCLALTLPALPQALPIKDSSLPPFVTTLAGPAPGGIRILNNYGHPLTNIALQWEQQVSGRIVQKGTVPILTIAPQKSATLHLALKPIPDPRDEAFLNIRYVLKKKDSTFPAGHTIAATQLLLKAATETDNAVHPAGPLTFTDENNAFVVSSPMTTTRFSKQTGFILQYIAKGDTLLDESTSLKPITPQEPRLQLFSTSTSTELAIVSADYSLPGDNILLHCRYTVNAGGELQVSQSIEIDTSANATKGDTILATKRDTILARIGATWSLPIHFDSTCYYGLSSSVKIEKQSFTANDFKSCRWLKLYNRNNHGILIRSDSAWLDINIASSGAGTQLTLIYPRYNLPLANYHYLYKVTPL